jgi:hypothetical protein
MYGAYRAGAEEGVVSAEEGFGRTSPSGPVERARRTAQSPIPPPVHAGVGLYSARGTIQKPRLVGET